MRATVFTLTTEEIEGTQEISYVNYAGLPEELQPGNAILLSDRAFGA